MSVTNQSVTVIVVNYNAGGLLEDCIRRVLSSSDVCEVHLVDNASTDDSLQFLDQFHDERLQLRRLSKNIGLSSAINRVLPDCHSAFTLLLNPDCLITTGALQRLLVALESAADIAMVGPLIQNPDGSEQRGCRRDLPTPMSALVRDFHLGFLGLQRFLQHWQNFDHTSQPVGKDPVVVEAISGAFMLIKTACFQDLQGMDSGFFLHCEDLDLCFRIRDAGRKILFVPTAVVIHAQGSCSVENPRLIEYYKHRGMCRYYLKHFQGVGHRLLSLILIPAIWLRFVFKALYRGRDHGA
ncbi:MAG TPA: glycosyltransferase family 2 protein [Gammaproteobacteria bacterium]|nr:glycosyltransferase family 2 protein [Gammaproteobacteria bacterium]